jgi:hypothetical protein
VVREHDRNHAVQRGAEGFDGCLAPECPSITGVVAARASCRLGEEVAADVERADLVKQAAARMSSSCEAGRPSRAPMRVAYSETR